MAKKTKNATPTPVEHYEMQKEFTRPTLMTGEYSGINPEELLGKPTPMVSYPLDGAARAARGPYPGGTQDDGGDRALGLREIYDTERNLLYVACTRARDYLLVTCAGTPSELLLDMGV